MPTPVPAGLSPALVPIYELELSLGNVVERVDRTLWTRCPLAVILREPMHFEEIARMLSLPPSVDRWESVDTHYDREAGYTCQDTRHSIAGPLPRT